MAFHFIAESGGIPVLQFLDEVSVGGPMGGGVKVFAGGMNLVDNVEDGVEHVLEADDGIVSGHAVELGMEFNV